MRLSKKKENKKALLNTWEYRCLSVEDRLGSSYQRLLWSSFGMQHILRKEHRFSCSPKAFLDGRSLQLEITSMSVVPDSQFKCFHEET